MAVVVAMRNPGQVEHFARKMQPVSHENRDFYQKVAELCLKIKKYLADASMDRYPF